MPDFQIRTSDVEAGIMLRFLADEDLRSIGNEVAWLIRQEYLRRHPASTNVESQPAEDDEKQ